MHMAGVPAAGCPLASWLHSHERPPLLGLQNSFRRRLFHLLKLALGLSPSITRLFHTLLSFSTHFYFYVVV